MRVEGIDEGYYNIVCKERDIDCDWGPCTGTTITNGTDRAIIVYTYDDHPDQMSFHVTDEVIGLDGKNHV